MTNKQWKDCLSEAMNDLIPNTPFETIAAGMPALAAATPVSVSRTHRVRRYVAAVAAAAVMMAGVGTWWYTRPEEKPPVTPATDDDAVTTTVTTAPTEQGVTTTTTVDTPTTNTTTNGGVVAPTTTVTTMAPTQTTAATGESTTSSKTNPTKTTATTSSKTTATTSDKTASTSPSTTPSKTEPSKTTAPSKTTHSTQTTRTTSTTKPTSATQPTVPPQDNDFMFKYPIDASEPMPIGAMSAKVPSVCSVTDEYVPVFLGYGLWGTHAWKPGDSDPVEKFVLRIVTDTKEEVVLKEIDPVDMNSPAYYAEILEDENGNYIGMTYTHTEMIHMPLSLCSKDSGIIWIMVQEYWYNGMVGGNCSSQVSLLYTRTKTGITFSVDSIWG